MTDKYVNQIGGVKLTVLLMLLAIVAVTVVIAGMISRSADSAEVAQWTAQRQIPVVSTTNPVKAVNTEDLQLAGRLQALKQASIYARVNGYIRRWHTDIGTRVQQGDVLAELDTPELDELLNAARAEVKRMEAQLELTASTLTRWQNLVETNAVSEQELAQRESEYRVAVAQLDVAKAQVRQLAVQKGMAIIKAPFSGVIVARNIDIGDLINAGSENSEPLFELAATNQLRLNVQVPQKFAPQIQVGSQGTVSVPEYRGTYYAAEVTRSASAIDPQNGTVMVQLLIDNNNDALLPGAYANVRLPVSSPAPVLTIPASAIIFNASGLSVATLNEDNEGSTSVELKSVKIARDLGRVIEIAEGLTEKDSVITNPPDGIASGEVVRRLTLGKSS